MIAAFPLFWNHRYPTAPQRYAPFTVKLYQADGVTVLEEVPILPLDGETPLERFAPWLLDEPAVSDEFNTEIRRVLKFLDQQGTKIRGLSQSPPPAWCEYQREVFSHDCVFFEVLRRPFQYGNETITLSQALKAFPIGQDTELPGGWKDVPRAALNGNVLWIIDWLIHADLFLDINGVTDLGKEVKLESPEKVAWRVLPRAELLKDFDAGTYVRPDSLTQTTTNKYTQSSPPPPL
jgi:hypothetical protein